MHEWRVAFVSFDGLVLHGTFARPGAVGRPGAPEAPEAPEAPDACGEADGSAHRGDATLAGVAVLVHGIGGDRDEWGFFSGPSGVAAALAARGIASLRFDWRCHGADQTETTALSLGGVLNDIDAAHAVARATFPAVPHALVALSFSAGLAIRWAAAHPQALAGVVACAPVLDYNEDFALSVGTAWRETLAARGTIDYAGTPLGRAIANELPHLGGPEPLAMLRCPLVVFHGDADEDVPLASSVRHCHLPGCQVVVVPGAAHAFYLPGVFDPAALASRRLRATTASAVAAAVAAFFGPDDADTPRTRRTQ